MTAGPRAPRCRTPDDLSCEYLRTSTSRENQKLSPTSRSQSQPNLQATSRSLEDRDRNPEPIRLPGLPDLRRDHLRACAAQATAGASFDEASEATETTYLANSEAATASKENRASTGMDSQGKDGQDGRRSASLPLDSAPRRFRHSGHSGFPGRAQEPAEFSRFIASEQTGYASTQMATSFTGSPLLVKKSKLEERPRRPSLAGNASEPLLPKSMEAGRRPRGLPAPGALQPALATSTRHAQATSAPMLGPLRTRPRSLDTTRYDYKAPHKPLPTLHAEMQASGSHVHVHQRKVSPAPTVSEEETELLR